jgi:lipopolysaccharide transport system permease protein
VPVFYSFDSIPERFRALYQYNPIAAVVLACRHILLEGIEPPAALMVKLALVSSLFLLLGFAVFGRLKGNFSDYL